MPESPFIAAGAQVGATSAAPLHTNEFFTGMWTQGNPLGSGAVPFLYQKFYSASRFDRLIGGANVEVTTRLTLARRPGHSTYNSVLFPPINRFYEFRAFSAGGENIHILASVDAPPPPVVLNIVSTEARIWVEPGTGGRVIEAYLIVTFSTPPPVFDAAAVYDFAGLTNQTSLNGQEWIPIPPGTFLPPDAPIPGPNQVMFLGPPLPWAPTADTGTAHVYVPGLLGASVRDVTGPTGNTMLWSKNDSAGRTSFQNVGNIVFFADGVDAKKWVLSGQSWAPLTTFSKNQFIVDPNNNLQLNIGAQSANLANISASNWRIGAVTGSQVTLFFSTATPLQLVQGALLRLTGLTTIPGLNGTTATVLTTANSSQVIFFVHPAITPVAFSVETGVATTGNGMTGVAPPFSWGNVLGAITQDAGAQWVNRGSAVETWGFGAPTIAPTVTQVSAPSLYPAWSAATWYGPTFVIIDSNGNIQQLITGGITGGAAPTWANVIGATTADNTAVWSCIGPAAWAASTNYLAGAMVQATFTYYVTIGSYQEIPPGMWNGFYNPNFHLEFVWTPTPVVATGAFRCSIAGTSGVSTPVWVNGLGTIVVDNTVTWTNLGTGLAWPGAAQTLSLFTKIMDSNGNIQTVQNTGKSGAVVPVWGTAQGALTGDGAATWLNAGPYTPAGTKPWKWAYSGKNSITGHIGTASPMSQPLIVNQSMQPVLQGAGLPNDPQIDELVLWRTAAGGSILLYLDTIPNPALGAAPNSWIYTDTTPDALLNELITAPIAHRNDPPAAGWTPQAYYLTRIWGFKANILMWTNGPDSITGSGNESMAPLNQFTFPSAGVTCWPTSIGLICYTLSDVWVVLGRGTANSPFYVINFQQGVGLANQDAITINGSTAYGMLTSGQVVSMDPGAGELEVGFPIGDQFNALYIPANTYCAWHQGSSADMALYVADGSTGWFRMAAVAAPESGNVWSPRALIQGGVKAIASIEILPGIKRLLLGPAVSGNPILMRDSTVSTDNSMAYPASANIGSIVMAQPGTTVGVQFVTTEEMMIAGSKPVSVGVLYDEISGAFSNLGNSTNDPPNLPASKTVRTKRFWAMQNTDAIICRHMQVNISWAAENYHNELLTYTIYGRLPEKARK